MILFLFFCSGATALVYEVVWSKYLSLMLGSTVQAQTVVLAVFMGGLALGNRIIGARSDLLKRPLAAYGYLEVLIGLYAFFFSAIFGFADSIFVGVGSRVFESEIGMFFLKTGLSVGLLALPTILMGGTLPLLAAWLQQQQTDDAGRWSARFYSTNSLGAVFGSFIAGFILIRTLGLVSTLQMTALANVVIGIAAVGLGRKFDQSAETQATANAAASTAPQTQTSGAMRWATLLVALTGAVSMGLEVLASRSLTLIFGASLQAFAVVLMAFILGIGAGSAAIASPRLKRWRSEGAIIGLLVTAAAMVGILILGIEQWVEIYRHIKVGLAPTRMGYRFYQAIMALFSFVVLGLPAALIGAVLPLCLRWVSDDGKGFGNRVGRLLTWNTLGAVVGVLFTGFVLMPNTGLRNAFNILAILLCVPAILLAVSAKRRMWLASASAVAIGLVISSVAGGEGWRQVLSSGVFRTRETSVDPTIIPQRKELVKILFYEDAPDATVSVEQSGAGTNMEVGLRINGKPEASTKGDLTTQLLCAHLPLLARPGSEDVFILGLASGISCAGFLAHPIKHLTVADNCEPVVRAVDFFAEYNRGVRTNPITRIRIEDARTMLKLENKNYDVIVSEPSNPWFASIGSVFSREFYELAKKRLKPGGIMVQWFHVYEMHDGIVEMVLRTFGSSFPVMEIWDTNEGDLILLGSDRPWETSIESLRKSYEMELVRKDLESIGVGTPETLLARLFASQRTASAIALSPGAIQTDGFPVLEYEAPVAFFIGAKAQRIMRFDERTWQAGFASTERRGALLALDEKAIRGVFERDSINRELWATVAERLKRAKYTSGQPAPTAIAPSLFDPSSTNVASWLPPDASPALKELITARVQLQQGEGDLVKNAELVRRTLAEQLVATGAATPERNSVLFAAIAARACILGKQYQLAADLIMLGQKFDPQDNELAFLSRMLERESGATTKIAGS